MPIRPLTHHQLMRKANPQPMREKRPTSAARGYGGAWQKYRASFLQRHPICAECRRENQVVPASVVDHIRPHKGDQTLFWDPANHQSLCKSHHDRKTATEDGGFGRRTKSVAGSGEKENNARP